MSNDLLPEESILASEPSRRQFLAGALSAAAAAPLLGATVGLAAAEPVTPPRKIKLGLVGCGGRGSWIANLFKEHGGYEFHAVADYFQDRADACGKVLGVDKSRCFSGLSGYKKVIESGVEAVALETPPGFFPEHARAAVEAGLHVYLAKPVAVDVPGCLTIEAAGKTATQKQRVFLVDYQMPTDPANIQVAERVRKGEIGKPAKMVSNTIGGYHADPPKTATIESRLKNGTWSEDLPLSGGTIVSFDIHMIDAALWVVGQRPVAAMGESRICRPNPHGDNPDVYAMIFSYTDGPLHAHGGLVLPTGASGQMSTTIFGPIGHAVLEYFGQARLQVRGQKPFVAQVDNLYPNGAKRNIATFHANICAGRFENPTLRRAVDSCLACILGREAGLRNGRLTMEELLKENKRYEIDLTGLKI
jgi:predicted dehydrogenase